jgi:hypothetical protein
MPVLLNEPTHRVIADRSLKAEHEGLFVWHMRLLRPARLCFKRRRRSDPPLDCFRTRPPHVADPQSLNPRILVAGLCIAIGETT